MRLGAVQEAGAQLRARQRKDGFGRREVEGERTLQSGDSFRVASRSQFRVSQLRPDVHHLGVVRDDLPERGRCVGETALADQPDPVAVLLEPPDLPLGIDQRRPAHGGRAALAHVPQCLQPLALLGADGRRCRDCLAPGRAQRVVHGRGGAGP